uniref:ENTH domain-containing protein n=1 Tax=Chromera velia CCMP2878 TaxID=1169474 RepID=A0A0K6S8V3_9ALVE|eukprot:Cvel_6473.t2-p1 / transcript=Cvel_6473.t2 / gene=Cvel_6473 / organism=Chromera_velia_CCMP2878 / gene_product=hypothetical protein / transcript_product=hypothetical protein / location=Cvel_scaffold317:81760-87671(+) / protein_length=707 / sequence_SO=supercontig / SO=protein_coding / is_pseudo=false
MDLLQRNLQTLFASAYSSSLLNATFNDSCAPKEKDFAAVLQGLMSGDKGTGPDKAKTLLLERIRKNWTWKVILKSLMFFHFTCTSSSSSSAWMEEFFGDCKVFESFYSFQENYLGKTGVAHALVIRRYATFLEHLLRDAINVPRFRHPLCKEMSMETVRTLFEESDNDQLLDFLYALQIHLQRCLLVFVKKAEVKEGDKSRKKKSSKKKDKHKDSRSERKGRRKSGRSSPSLSDDEDEGQERRSSRVSTEEGRMGSEDDSDEDGKVNGKRKSGRSSRKGSGKSSSSKGGREKLPISSEDESDESDEEERRRREKEKDKRSKSRRDSSGKGSGETGEDLRENGQRVHSSKKKGGNKKGDGGSDPSSSSSARDVALSSGVSGGSSQTALSEEFGVEVEEDLLATFCELTAACALQVFKEALRLYSMTTFAVMELLDRVGSLDRETVGEALARYRSFLEQTDGVRFLCAWLRTLPMPLLQSAIADVAPLPDDALRRLERRHAEIFMEDNGRDGRTSADPSRDTSLPVVSDLLGGGLGDDSPLPAAGRGSQQQNGGPRDDLLLDISPSVYRHTGAGGVDKQQQQNLSSSTSSTSTPPGGLPGEEGRAGGKGRKERKGEERGEVDLLQPSIDVEIGGGVKNNVKPRNQKAGMQKGKGGGLFGDSGLSVSGESSEDSDDGEADGGLFSTPKASTAGGGYANGNRTDAYETSLL